jgi:hypothetical protein
VSPDARPTWLQVALLSVPIACLAGAGWYLVQHADAVGGARCNPKPDESYLPDYGMLAVLCAMIAAGRYWGPRTHRTPQRPGGRQWSDMVGILSFMLLFAASAGALIFEAVGVLASQSASTPALKVIAELEPITHYVRCAIHYDKVGSSGVGWVTYFVAGLTCYLVGNWLWPSRVPRLQPIASSDRPARPVLPLPVAVLGALIIVVGVGYFLSLLLDLAFASQPAIEALNVRRVTPVAVAGGTYQEGIKHVIIFVFGVLTSIVLLDVVFAWRKWNPISLRVQEWARVNPLFAAALVILVGALLAHFIGNPVHYAADQ